MLRRVVALVVLVWVMGFFTFAISLPVANEADHADAVVVLTGGEGRIDRGLAVLRAHRAGRMLVAGVDPEVKPREFAAQYHVERALMRCCVTLGYQSVDTRSNASETALWVEGMGVEGMGVEGTGVASGKISSVLLVTSDWHMRRAAFELRRTLPPQVALIEDGVPTSPSLRTLFLEYNKYVARRISLLWRV